MREALLYLRKPSMPPARITCVMMETGGAACQEIADGTFFQGREGLKKKVLGVAAGALLLPVMTNK